MYRFTKPISVPRIADVHCHLRQGEVVPDLIRHSYQGGADVLLAMPNLKKPLTTPDQVQSYTDDLISCMPSEAGISFIRTAYVTPDTTAAAILGWQGTDVVFGLEFVTQSLQCHRREILGGFYMLGFAP